MKLGARKVLEGDDIGVPSEQHEADKVYSLALAAWEQQTTKTSKWNERFNWHTKPSLTAR